MLATDAYEGVGILLLELGARIMRENTKCSGEGTGSEKNISELGVMAKENELRKEVKSALIGL